jgi:hypothetical protein
MKLLRMLMMLWVGSFFFIAPAVLHAEIIPDAGQTTRLNFQGYSIFPPPGSNWQVLQKEQNNIVFTKDLKSKTHTFVANVFAVPLTIGFETPEDFLNFIKKSKDANIEPRRFRMLENEVVLDDAYGPYCVRYHQKAVDRGALSSGKAPYLILDTYGYACIHPDTPELAVDIGYSERFAPGESNAELREEGQQFIRGLKFTPLDGR